MTLHCVLRSLQLGGLAAVALASTAAPVIVSAQEVDDGFRPVWQQQQRSQPAAAHEQAAQARERARRERLAQRSKSRHHKNSEAEHKEAPKEAQKGEAANAQAAKDEGKSVSTTTTQYQHWTLTCREVAGAKPPKTCAAALRVVGTDKKLVLLLELTRGKDGAVEAVMQTPTGVLVKKGVELKIGDKVEGKLDYLACVPQNCEATATLDEALRKKLSATKEVAVLLHSRDGREIQFKFPIEGIDKAMAALRS